MRNRFWTAKRPKSRPGTPSVRRAVRWSIRPRPESIYYPYQIGRYVNRQYSASAVGLESSARQALWDLTVQKWLNANLPHRTHGSRTV